jgi:hypothetical protein
MKMTITLTRVLEALGSVVYALLMASLVGGLIYVYALKHGGLMVVLWIVGWLVATVGMVAVTLKIEQGWRWLRRKDYKIEIGKEKPPVAKVVSEGR